MTKQLLLLCFVALPAFAEAPKGLIAVLPVDARRANIDESTKVALEESIRTVAGDVLSPYGFTVLTNDTTLAVLAENNIDASKVCDASCALDAAREMKASAFISTVVTRSEGELLSIVRLFDSASGRQLASAQLESKTVREARKAFTDQSRKFFAPLTGEVIESAPSAAVPPAAPAGPAEPSFFDKLVNGGSSKPAVATPAPPPPPPSKKPKAKIVVAVSAGEQGPFDVSIVDGIATVAICDAPVTPSAPCTLSIDAGGLLVAHKDAARVAAQQVAVVSERFELVKLANVTGDTSCLSSICGGPPPLAYEFRSAGK